MSMDRLAGGTAWILAAGLLCATLAPGSRAAATPTRSDAGTLAPRSDAAALARRSSAAAREGIPRIAALAPNNGAAAGATPVRIAGAGFTAGSTVRFGEVLATAVRVQSPTSITALSPSESDPSGVPETVEVAVETARGTSQATPRDRFAYNSAPGGPWLGLDGNSDGAWAGKLDDFTAHGILYDRGGAPGIDWTAGELLQRGGVPTESARALARSIDAGMIPDITIEYAGYTGAFRSDPRFPTESGGSKTLERYVRGFVASAEAILKAYPRSVILFEPMNEPWADTTPQYDGAQYAQVIARLMPALRAASIPLDDIYVAATGGDCTASARTTQCTAEGWIPAMYSAQPQLRWEIEGWYFHPYGSPSALTGGESGGIRSLPAIQALMTSGQNDILVSEVGFCDRELDPEECSAAGYPDVASGGQAARALSEAALHGALLSPGGLAQGADPLRPQRRRLGDGRQGRRPDEAGSGARGVCRLSRRQAEE